MQAFLSLCWRVPYTICFSMVIVIGVLLALPAMLLPTLAMRRTVSGALLQVALWLVGIRISVRGIEQLPAETSVVVANHFSFMDGPLLNTVLPSRFGFVIKREMAGVPVLGWLLRRLGSVFVERADAAQGSRDGMALIRLVREGHSLGVFAEGGYGGANSLGPLRMGAFLAATRANCPVVPVVILGTDYVMPGDAFRPRPGRIDVQIMPPLYPTGASRDDAKELRDRTAAVLQAHWRRHDH